MPDPPELPPGVDPEILQDVRRVQQCRAVFASTHQHIEVWEVFCLVMMARDWTKEELARLLALQSAGDEPAFQIGALELFERLLSLRARFGKLVRDMRKYIARLQVGTFARETLEMALGFIVVSARGRDYAKQWLEEPRRYEMQAAGRLEALLSTVMNYERALRALPPS